MAKSEAWASPANGSRRRRERPLITRRRFQVAVALAVAVILPVILRLWTAPEELQWHRVENGTIANAAAVLLAFWIRLSIDTYPGLRAGYAILPILLSVHSFAFVIFGLGAIPSDRVTMFLGFLFHLFWSYATYFLGEHRLRPRIAVVGFGATDSLRNIDRVDWVPLARADLRDTYRCNAIVADFSAEMPDEWEAFLADAALAGRIVYQVKQLSESLTGRVELTHLSENSFGSLVPARGYFHLKTLLDWLFAVAVLPLALVIMAAAAIAIRLDSRGPALFRQARVGHAGRIFTVYKFRTMRMVEADDARRAAMTAPNDDRVTGVGRFLRRTRIDELPQIFNILRMEMSWIGPRPEAEVLSIWYTSELPFYRYRHVVKPGISGWAQVNQGHVADVDEVHQKLQYDFYYIKYFSPWLDLLIAFRTVITIFTGFGSR